MAQKYEKGSFITVPNIKELEKLDDALSTAIFLGICRYADDKGICFPAIPKLAKTCGCSERTVQRRINFLAQFGFLEKIIRKKRNGKENTSNKYQILLSPDVSDKDALYKAKNEMKLRDKNKRRCSSVTTPGDRATQKLKPLLTKSTILYKTGSKKFEPRTEKKKIKNTKKKTKKEHAGLLQPKKKVKSPRLASVLAKTQTPDEACLDYKKHCINLGPRLIWNLVEQESYNGERRLIQTEIDVSADDFAELMIQLMAEFRRINPGANTLPYNKEQWKFLEGMVENKEIGISGVMEFIKLREIMDKFDSTELLDFREISIYLNLGMHRLPQSKTPVSMSNESSKFIKFKKKFDSVVDFVDDSDDESLELDKELFAKVNEYRAEGLIKKDILSLTGFNNYR